MCGVIEEWQRSSEVTWAGSCPARACRVLGARRSCQRLTSFSISSTYWIKAFSAGSQGRPDSNFACGSSRQGAAPNWRGRRTVSLRTAFRPLALEPGDLFLKCGNALCEFPPGRVCLRSRRGHPRGMGEDPQTQEREAKSQHRHNASAGGPPLSRTASAVRHALRPVPSSSVSYKPLRRSNDT